MRSAPSSEPRRRCRDLVRGVYQVPQMREGFANFGREPTITKAIRQHFRSTGFGILMDADTLPGTVD